MALRRVSLVALMRNAAPCGRNADRTRIIRSIFSLRPPSHSFYTYPATQSQVDCGPHSVFSRLSSSTTAASPLDGPKGVAADESWSEHSFSQVAEATLECISEAVADVGYKSEQIPGDFDVCVSQGVLTISMGDKGTYVLNTQTPNRQIWMSSPVSGPWRYSWYAEEHGWFSTRDGHSLASRLSSELSDVLGETLPIDFSEVSGAEENS